MAGVAEGLLRPGVGEDTVGARAFLSSGDGLQNARPLPYAMKLRAFKQMHFSHLLFVR